MPLYKKTCANNKSVAVNKKTEPRIPNGNAEESEKDSYAKVLQTHTDLAEPVRDIKYSGIRHGYK